MTITAITIAATAPWAAGIALVLARVGTRLTDPPMSYFESAHQRLSVR
ncbi:MAG TPA: hypothetical protein VKP14_02665 [Gaiellaceae bacterium]|nr:hypothetical protein [Gaiellaceae bacterium]